jgi:cytochrome o ubiquinol oxidase subunit 2
VDRKRRGEDMIRTGRSCPTIVLLAVAGLAGCSGGVLDPQGPVGMGNRTILLNSLAVMLVIVIPTILASLWFAWWFRASNNRAKYDPSFIYSGRIELVVWSIPTLTILFLGGLIYYGSYELDPRKPLSAGKPTLEVQVVALDWKWLFIYPDQQVASVNELIMPAGTPVLFRLSSASVMNTFFVPQLGSMIYVMNGMESKLNLLADKPGVLYGQSAHFSGDGFSDMNFPVRVLPAEAFSQWAAKQRGGNRILNAQAYADLAKQSQDVAPFAFSSIQPGLFDAVVRQYLPPAPGPNEGRGGDPEIHPNLSGQATPTIPAAMHEQHGGG